MSIWFHHNWRYRILNIQVVRNTNKASNYHCQLDRGSIINSYRALELMHLYIRPLLIPLCAVCVCVGIVPWQRRPVKPGSHLHLQDVMLRCPCRPQLIRHGFLGISDNNNVNTNNHMLQNQLHWNWIVVRLKKSTWGIKNTNGEKKRPVISRL